MKKILLVEDDAALQDAFSMTLTASGYDVTTANDGADGLEKVAKEKYDLILLDILMPQVDGKEFLRRFDNTHKTPVVVFTNLDARVDIDEVMELGADRCVLKSWASPAQLIKLVRDYTE